MKLIPMLFSTPMVRALLAGNKTQTRRLVKNPINAEHEGKLLADWALSGLESFEDGVATFKVQCDVDRSTNIPTKCPYGKVGDVIWVKETHEFISPRKTIDGKRADTLGCVHYKADHEYASFEQALDFNPTYNKWRSSMYMPKEACRIFLEIVGVSVERVQNINEAGAIAEGVASTQVTFSCSGSSTEYRYQNYSQRHDINHPLHRWTHTAAHSYRTLWNKINGKGSWESNPYVWVVEFKKVAKAK